MPDFDIVETTTVRAKGLIARVWLPAGGKLSDIAALVSALNRTVPADKHAQVTVRVDVALRDGASVPVGAENKIEVTNPQPQ